MAQTFFRLEDISDRLGIPLERLRAIVQTHLVKISQGLVSLEDVVAVHEAEKEIGDLPTLVTELAALKAEVLRQRSIIQFVLRIAGLQQHFNEITDSQLLQLLAISRQPEIVQSISTRNVARRIRHIVDLCLCLTDREFRRLEKLTEEPRCWRSLIFMLENLDDFLASKPDFRQRQDIHDLRAEVNLARLHLVNQGKFTLALNDPFCDPKKLLGEICMRAAKLELLDSTAINFDPAEAISALTAEIQSTQ